MGVGGHGEKFMHVIKAKMHKSVFFPFSRFSMFIRSIPGFLFLIN